MGYVRVLTSGQELKRQSAIDSTIVGPWKTSEGNGHYVWAEHLFRNLKIFESKIDAPLDQFISGAPGRFGHPVQAVDHIVWESGGYHKGLSIGRSLWMSHEFIFHIITLWY